MEEDANLQIKAVKYVCKYGTYVVHHEPWTTVVVHSK